MGLEVRRGKSRWWYGRVTVRGRLLARNLGVLVEGQVPPRLSEVGDIKFERSRAQAQAALERWQIEMKQRRSAEELVQTIHEIRTGERVRSLELKDMAARWKDLPRRRPLSASYLKQAETRIQRFRDFLTSRFPAVREMADVQPYMGRDFMKAEVARGVAGKTYNANLIFLRSCFGALRDEAGIPKNPFAGIPTVEVTPMFRKPFTVDELKLIVEAAKPNWFIYPIIVTGICTAMRRGDCCLLRKDSVDLANRFITVKTSKTGEFVQIPIFPLLYEVLAKVDFNEAPESPFVFHAQAIKYLAYPDKITYQVREVLRKVGSFNPDEAENEEEKALCRGEISRERPDGLRRASVRDFHSFRVSWVTLALLSGVPLEIVQKITGHRTAEIVMRHYFQPRREDYRRLLAQKMPVLLGGEVKAEPPTAEALKAKIAAMTPDTWMAIRNEIMAAANPATQLVEIETTPMAANVALTFPAQRLTVYVHPLEMKWETKS